MSARTRFDRRSALTLAVGAAAGLAAARPAPAEAAGEEFELTVTFGLPDAPDAVVLKTAVTPGVPFTKQARKPLRGFNAVGGMLLPRKPGESRYELVLTLTDYTSDRANTLGSTLVRLTPGVPFGWGSIAGGVSRAYSALLTPGG
jgi:hypothetical protein